MISWIESKETIKTVGVVGCGRMGRCMVEKLVQNGYKTVCYDPFQSAIDEAVKLGAYPLNSAAAVAQEAQMIMLSLPGPAQLEEAIFSAGGLAEKLTNKHVVIDTSTVDPKSTRSISTRLADLTGTAYLDSPILGRPSGVGKWMLPTGGNAKAMEWVRPVLLTFAGNVLHVGDSGAGNALKLLNQLMFSCINATTCEVMAICEHVGIDQKVFYETVANSPAATVSGLFKELGRCIVDDGFEQPSFTLDLLSKDARLALQMAKDYNAPALLAGSVQSYNEIGHAQGLGSLDSSALYKTFSQHYTEIV